MQVVRGEVPGIASILLLLGVFLLVIFFIAGGLVFRGSLAVDNQCAFLHQSATIPPMNLKTANDFFEQGNYDYDIGNCSRSIVDYSKAIEMNPNFAAAYNNRAYTYMRMKNYAAAVQDLDRAIAIRPNYAHALMNRGDIYNFYYEIDRNKAIADYDRIIATGQTSDTSVCGHRMLAKSGGWRPAVAVYLFNYLFDRSKEPGC